MKKLKRNLTKLKRGSIKPKMQPNSHKGPWHVKQVASDNDGIPPKTKPLGRKLKKRKRKRLHVPKNHGQGAMGDNSTGSGFGTSHPVQK